jgi:Protein of unknown function (DUF4058)
MPLLDHFHPPLSQRRHWDSFHGAWAEAMAAQLNQDLLPRDYYAEARVKLGTATNPDLFEVQVLHDEEGPRLVAAIELASPANKDRPANRQIFAVKCASYLQSGVSVVIVDIVTERSGNLHTELLRLLETQAATAVQEPNALYAAGYRTLPRPDRMKLEIWAESLAVGEPLPTLPLWIGPEQAVPLHLEQTYQVACAARRIR